MSIIAISVINTRSHKMNYPLLKRSINLLKCILAGTVLLLSIQSHASEFKPMPPIFNLNLPAEDILRKYPIGEITATEAHHHHGKEHRLINLANGYKGHLYNVGKAETHRTFTLVIDKYNTVVDVLYSDHVRYSKTGLSALLLQSQQIKADHQQNY